MSTPISGECTNNKKLKFKLVSTAPSLFAAAGEQLSSEQSAVALESPQGVSHTSLRPGSVMKMISVDPVQTKNKEEANADAKKRRSIKNNFYWIIGKVPIIKALSKGLYIFLPVKIHPNYLASLTLDLFTLPSVSELLRFIFS